MKNGASEVVVGVIVARVGSTRFPGKMLLPFGSRTILETVVARSRECRLIQKIVLATTVSEIDDPIVEIADRNKLVAVRGSEDDVVSRMLFAVRTAAPAATIVVRICADNPMIMPSVVDDAIATVISDGLDLITYAEFPTIPFGYSAVTMTRRTLERIDREAQELQYREHVENYCIDNPEQFNLRYQLARSEIHFPELLLSLDYEADYNRLKYWYGKVSGCSIEAQPEHLVELVRSSRIYIETQGRQDKEDLKNILHRVISTKIRFDESPIYADIAFFLKKPDGLRTATRGTFWAETAGMSYRLIGRFAGIKTPQPILDGESGEPVTHDNVIRNLVPAVIRYLIGGFPRVQEIGSQMIADSGKINHATADLFRDRRAVLFPPIIVFEFASRVDKGAMESILEEIIFFNDHVQRLILTETCWELEQRLRRLQIRFETISTETKNIQESLFDCLTISGFWEYRVGEIVVSASENGNCRLKISEVWQTPIVQTARAKHKNKAGNKIWDQ
jgi:spore coat polysaccharide biosynthesis protein SpsF